MIDWEEIFEEFLKDRDVWESYKAHRNAAIGNEAIELLGDFVSDAFVWDETPEGLSFWSNLNNDWEDIIELKQRQGGEVDYDNPSLLFYEICLNLHNDAGEIPDGLKHHVDVVCEALHRLRGLED